MSFGRPVAALFFRSASRPMKKTVRPSTSASTREAHASSKPTPERLREQIDAARRKSQLRDHPRLFELRGGDARGLQRRAEASQGFEDASGIVLGRPDEDVDVAAGPGSPMERERVGTDDEELDTEISEKD